MNRELTINLLPSCKDSRLHQQAGTWKEILQLLDGNHMSVGSMTLNEDQHASDAQNKAQKDRTCWIPCSVVDVDGNRNQANMHEAHLLVLDIDTGVPLDDVKARLNGHEAAIHSSFSHTPERIRNGVW